MLVRWPGKIKAGSVSSHVLYFPDVMPTLSEMTLAKCPRTDGLSFLPTLLGTEGQKQHAYFYWEYQNQTAVRMKNWKAYKKGDREWELYDLSKDIEEKNDVAESHPNILARLESYAEKAHLPVKPGKIYDRELTAKDHRQAPHPRNLKSKK